MIRAGLEQRLDQLVTVLGELRRLYDELAVVVRNKLTAMRKAETDAIRSACSREEFLTQKIAEQDGLRKQILDLIGELLILGDRKGRTLTITELNGYISEPYRSRLVGLAAALRSRLEETAEMNRVAAIVSHEMVKHFHQVYEVMARANESAGLYSRTGQAVTRPAVTVFDAVV